jgi:ATP-dependent DNA helicase RecQ
MQWTLLLIAPPACGKTHYLTQLMRDYPKQKIIFLSPLRAIAEEMYQKVESLQIACQFLKPNQKIEQTQFYISTVELFKAEYLYAIQDAWVVFDEFHLIYLWENFRPQLTDLWRELVLAPQPLLLLSATISVSCLERLKTELLLNDRELWLADYGNFKYKYHPRQHCLPHIQAMMLSMLKHVSEKENSLLFCNYRQQVKQISQQLESFEIPNYHCVGGEAAQFSQQLHERLAHLVLATSVLSHGVNLPIIKHVYFLQKSESAELDLQMQTRGGRDGSGYNVYFILKYSPKAWLNYALLLGAILLKIKYWKLVKISKELSLKKFPSKKKISCWWSYCDVVRRSLSTSMEGKAVVKLIARVSYNWGICWSFSYKQIKRVCRLMFTQLKIGT